MIAANSGGSVLRGITTRSTPAGSFIRDNRKASRINRFHRLRMTALPTFRETESPSRGCVNPFVSPKTSRSPSEAEQRRSYVRLKSAPRRIRYSGNNRRCSAEVICTDWSIFEDMLLQSIFSPSQIFAWFLRIAIIDFLKRVAVGGT
jgi:hypothetical protein